jgi:Flp pilus assembly pilin Flp
VRKNPSTNLSRPRPESGNGVLEYGLLLGLLVIALIAVYAVFGPDIRDFLGNLLRREEPPGQQFMVIEMEETFTVIDQEVISLRNCDNPEDLGETVERVRQHTGMYFIDAEIDFALLEVLLDQLEQYYGINVGELVEQRYTIPISADPNSAVDYTVEWQEIWGEGEIVVEGPANGDEETYPYYALKGIEFSIEDIQPVACP